MKRDSLHFLLLNIGHFLDHFFTLIFATIAALALTREWGVSYGDLLVYATPGDSWPSVCFPIRPAGSPTSGAARA